MANPLFYHLACHGPWTHHVKVRGSGAMDDATTWLVEQGRVENQDFEVVHLDSGSSVGMIPFSMSRGTGGRRLYLPKSRTAPMEVVFFFRDPSLATYVKLTWGNA